MGILGESGIMTVLGLNIFSIPFFLILPGFLFLVIWSSFLPAIYKTQKTLLGTDKKEPFFWVAAITLSLVLSILYAFISQQAVWISYGLLDIFFLWMGSILLAILLLFAVYMSIASRARYEASKDFTVRDTPWMVLERLRKREAGFYLDQGELTDSASLLFRLGTNRSQTGEPPVLWYSCGGRLPLFSIGSPGLDRQPVLLPSPDKIKVSCIFKKKGLLRGRPLKDFKHFRNLAKTCR
jgi:hypothetical protein